MKSLIAVTGLFALFLAGCGYNQSGGENNKQQGGYHWNSLYREDIQTVAVPVFGTRDFRRGIEFRLTEAVIKQLEANAPYKVVPKERADTILEGQVTAVKVGTLSKDFQTNLPREQELVITIDLTWKDLRTGKILLQRRGLQQEGIFYPSLGEGEFAGTQQAIERFALAIVQELQADW
ncbi:MAG TPA: LptE family protein [Tepidisphaeraceae bacterium]|jgi:hypothetical protein|nr:LptE family protein [Tepidisphaeraceae bacterium]